MLRKLAYQNANRFVSNWVIFAVDMLIVGFSIQFAYLIRFNFQLDFIDKYPLKWHLLFLLSTYAIGFLIVRPFSGIIRHTSIKDLEKLLLANMIALSMGLLVNSTAFSSQPFVHLRIPLSIFFILFLMVTFIMSVARFFIKTMFIYLVRKKTSRKAILIYGAGKAGLMTKHVLEQEGDLIYQILAFIDDNPSKVGKNLEGIPVLSAKKIDKLLETSRVKEVIIAIQKIAPERKREIIDLLLDHDIVIKNIPPVSQWINGEFSSVQIRNVEIEDLLERHIFKPDRIKLKDQLEERVVLITGAAGSIGSEIARQVIVESPLQLVLIDQAESALYDLCIDLERKYNGSAQRRMVKYVCDVTNYERIERIFKKHQPDVIYHAAAYKHVPLMEANPSEAIEVNIFGTKVMADLANKYRSDKFVFISTDKAVNPTNVMGASKRIAEMYCQSLNSNHTRYITTRFGNVLGSNGSVIPLFKRQIADGGPITVTHKEITRFFMTIPEACELVLEAGAMGEGGEILVFDMGKPVKIFELAQKMIRLSGFTEEEIGIKITGLRPGEKLYEEVLSKEENIIRTYHPKINIAKVRSCDKVVLQKQLIVLLEAIKEGNDYLMVKQMKKIVPEYKSINSDFQLLDSPDRSSRSKLAI